MVQNDLIDDSLTTILKISMKTYSDLRNNDMKISINIDSLNPEYHQVLGMKRRNILPHHHQLSDKGLNSGYEKSRFERIIH